MNQTASFRLLPPWLRQSASTAPLPQLRRAWGRYTSCSLWAGTAQSGSGYHYHNAAVNALFFGLKHWKVAPPRWAGLTDLDTDAWPDPHAAAYLPRGLPLRFTQRPGDVVLLPEQWGHATLSDNVTLGLGMLWCGVRLTGLTGSCHLQQSAYRHSGQSGEQ